MATLKESSGWLIFDPGRSLLVKSYMVEKIEGYRCDRGSNATAAKQRNDDDGAVTNYQLVQVVYCVTLCISRHHDVCRCRLISRCRVMRSLRA